jgi:hypothetical protein
MLLNKLGVGDRCSNHSNQLQNSNMLSILYFSKPIESDKNCSSYQLKSEKN